MTVLESVFAVALWCVLAGATGWVWWTTRETIAGAEDVDRWREEGSPPWALAVGDIEEAVNFVSGECRRLSMMAAHLQERLSDLEATPAIRIPDGTPTVDILAVMDRMASSQQLALDTLAKLATPTPAPVAYQDRQQDQMEPTADVWNSLDPTDFDPYLGMDGLRDLTGASFSPNAPRPLVDNPIGIEGLEMPDGGWPKPIPGGSSWGVANW